MQDNVDGYGFFLMKTAKYTLQDYKMYSDFFQNLKLTRLKRKSIITAISGYNIFSDGQRQTNSLNYEISSMWETKLKTTAQKIFGLLMRPEQDTRPKNLQAM